MKKQSLQPQKSMEDFAASDILDKQQQKQVKGGDDSDGDNGEIVTHEDVVEI